MSNTIDDGGSALCTWDSADTDWDVPVEDPAPDVASFSDTTSFDGGDGEPWGLPDHAEARALSRPAPGYLDDGFSCRPDGEDPVDADAPVRGAVTVRDGQGILTALQSAGVPKDSLRAAYGSLVSSGQLTADDFVDDRPVVQPGRRFDLDSSTFTAGNARLGGLMITGEHTRRALEEAERERTARPAPAPALTPVAVVSRDVAEEAPSAWARTRDQIASSTLIVAEPLVRSGAQVGAWLGVDVEPQAVSDNMFGAARELIVGDPLPAGSKRVGYLQAQAMSVAPLGIGKYDTRNITYHDYRLDTTLCHRSEAFCTIENLSPLVDFSSAPKAGWRGFEAMENGTQRLIGGHPIEHLSDHAAGTFSNQTRGDHVFHSGTVESRLYWKGDELHLGTVGYGYGATPLHTAANYAVGLSYFSLWQTAVKIDVQAIRTFHSR